MARMTPGAHPCFEVITTVFEKGEGRSHEMTLLYLVVLALLFREDQERIRSTKYKWYRNVALLTILASFHHMGIHGLCGGNPVHVPTVDFHAQKPISFIP